MSETPRTTKSEAIRTLAAYGHAACDRVEQLETKLAEITRQRNAYKKALEMAEDELMTVRAEIEALMFLVKNQRCCRNCGNHASWQFDICGLGENPQDENEGPHCRRNDLKRWRPMEYRRAKESTERGE